MTERGGQINDFSRTAPPYLGTYWSKSPGNFSSASSIDAFRDFRKKKNISAQQNAAMRTRTLFKTQYVYLVRLVQKINRFGGFTLMSLHMVWRPQNSWCLQKKVQSLPRTSHLKFCNIWYNERIGEQGSRTELWQYFLIKSCSEWPDMLYWMSETPSGTSNHRHQSWSPLLDGLNGHFNTSASHQNKSCF